MKRKPQPKRPLFPWPNPAQLERMGFVRCQQDGCTVYVDPANMPGRRCLAHQREVDELVREQRRRRAGVNGRRREPARA